MKLLIDGMSKCVDIDIVGKGLEPRLQFPTGTKTIGPTLPFDPVSTEIMVHNPCDYPVEFIATQFDQLQHLERQVCVVSSAVPLSEALLCCCNIAKSINIWRFENINVNKVDLPVHGYIPDVSVERDGQCLILLWVMTKCCNQYVSALFRTISLLNLVS